METQVPFKKPAVIL